MVARLARVCLIAFAIALPPVVPATASAGPANPQPFIVQQPDGSSFIARLFGDERSNGHETLEGFTIVRDRPSGVWVYADRSQTGALVATRLVVGRDRPVGLQRHRRAAIAAAPGTAGSPAPARAPGLALGTRRTLVLLVAFADKAPATSAAAWQSVVFGTTTSVAHHYATSSYGAVTVAPAAETNGVANDGIVGWLTLPTNHPNTGDVIGTANLQLTRDAIVAADPYVNFAAFDSDRNGRLTPNELMIVVVAAGSEAAFSSTCAPSLWGHESSVPLSGAPTVDGVIAGADGYAQFGELHCTAATAPGQIATFGIVAHEMGHLFGLPDLYDLDGSSDGIGDWSLMSLGVWNGIVRQGDSPALLDAWSKSALGWVTPMVVIDTLTDQSIQPSDTSGIVYQFLSGSALEGVGEYFLVENRQQRGYDAALPGSGLIVWHVDESRWSNSAECVPGGVPACSDSVHYKVAVVPADGLFDLERGNNAGDGGDPFPGWSATVSLTDATVPSARLWSGRTTGISIVDITTAGALITATLSISSSAPAVFGKTTPVSGATGVSTTPTLAWSASAGATGYEYCIDSTNDGACTSWLGVSSSGATPSGLSPATTYWWQVRATNANGSIYADGSSAAFWNFTTAPPVNTFDQGAVGPADFDGDGTSDILWSHTDGRAALWLMNGASATGGGGILGAGTGWSPVRLADLNGDGKSDLIWQHTDGSAFAWLMNGATVIGGVNLLGPGTGWSARQTGDFNADGKQDILWRHTDGSVAVWLMDGPNIIGSSGLLAAGSGWDAVQLGDFNGDGKQDIVWQHADGSTCVWLMNGLNVVGGGGLVGGGTGWSVRLIGDLDADGKSDVLWVHADGRVTLWLMNGVSVTGGGGILGAGTGWTPVRLADFNGDGRSDILWQHTNGSVYAWLMNGASVVNAGSFFGPGTGWTVSQTGDYDKDGKQDILWRNTDGSVVMWLMNGLSQVGGGGLLDAATGWSPAP